MLRNILLQVTNASVCALSASVGAPSVAPKNRFALFPSLPNRCLSPAGLRTSRARSRGGASVPPRFRPSLACSFLGQLSARASQVASRPLPSVPSVAPSAPSASASVGRFRASAWLKSPSRVAQLCTTSASPHAPPLVSPFPRFAPRWGALSPSPFGSGASGWLVPRPPPLRRKRAKLRKNSAVLGLVFVRVEMSHRASQ